jgi:tRNA pseudouridine38-40 synthase
MTSDMSQSERSEVVGSDGAGQGGASRVYLLTVAYDGSAYCGWQYQPGLPSVQETLERALRAVLGHPVRALASSRTDTGVHALAQAVAFRSPAWNASLQNLPFALNTHLPLSVVVRQASEVPPTFHPLRNSTGKRYRYLVYNSRIGDPIGSRTHWWVRRRMNLEAMQAAAAHLIGKHDFYSFQSAGSPRSSTVRTIRSLTVQAQPYLDGQMFSVQVEADGFLYNMVRNIVGTLVQVAVGRKPDQWILQVLAARDRQAAGAAAPPQGLTLMEVMFDGIA